MIAVGAGTPTRACLDIISGSSLCPRTTMLSPIAFVWAFAWFLFGTTNKNADFTEQVPSLMEEHGDTCSGQHFLRLCWVPSQWAHEIEQSKRGWKLPSSKSGSSISTPLNPHNRGCRQPCIYIHSVFVLCLTQTISSNLLFIWNSVIVPVDRNSWESEREVICKQHRNNTGSADSLSRIISVSL